MKHDVLLGRLINFMNARADGLLQFMRKGAGNDSIQCHIDCSYLAGPGSVSAHLPYLPMMPYFWTKLKSSVFTLGYFLTRPNKVTLKTVSLDELDCPAKEGHHTEERGTYQWIN